MTISFVGIGQTSESGSGNVTPSLPLGWQANDIFICIIASKDNVNSTMPNGWIAIDPGTNNGYGLRTTTYYNVAVVGDTNPLVKHPSGNYIEATIMAYRGVATSGSPLDVIGTTTVNRSSNIVIANAITTTINGAVVIFTGSIASASSFSNYSGTPTPTERLDTYTETETEETETGGTEGTEIKETETGETEWAETEEAASIKTTTYNKRLESLQTNYPSTFAADFTLDTAGNTGNRTATATVAAVNNGLLFALKPNIATIICITDPSDANIYIDGVLRPVTTSTSITVSTGRHTVTFSKAGYQSYTTTITGLGSGQTLTVCAILQQIANITGYGIVVCTTSNISSCPITPLTCPISASPSDYINFIATINSTKPISLTVNFTYILDSTTYIASVSVSLMAGTNVVFGFPANVRYSPNTIISLTGITFS